MAWMCSWVRSCMVAALLLQATTAWELLWCDDFDGANASAPHDVHWTPMIGRGCEYFTRNLSNGAPVTNQFCGWGNEESQYYTNTADNVALDGNGTMRITARQDPNCGDCTFLYSIDSGSPLGKMTRANPTLGYTSARLHSRGLVYFDAEEFHGPNGTVNLTDGLRVEARIRLGKGGQGMWPAFWMVANDYPGKDLDLGINGGHEPCAACSIYGDWAASGEIDILESINDYTNATATVHYAGVFDWDAYIHDRISDAISGWKFANVFQINSYVQGLLRKPGAQTGKNYANEWHSHALDWFPNGTMFFALDGSRYHQMQPCNTSDMRSSCCDTCKAANSSFVCPGKCGCKRVCGVPGAPACPGNWTFDWVTSQCDADNCEHGCRTIGNASTGCFGECARNFSRSHSCYFSACDMEKAAFHNDVPGHERAPFDVPFFMILQLATGGRYPGWLLNETVFPQTIDFSYVRVCKGDKNSSGCEPPKDINDPGYCQYPLSYQKLSVPANKLPPNATNGSATPTPTHRSASASRFTLCLPWLFLSFLFVLVLVL